MPNWKEVPMPVADTLLLSVVGILMVMCVLAFLAAMIVLMSKAMASRAAAETAPAEKPVAGAPVRDADEEGDLAVIMSVICEEMNARPEELVFKEVRQVS